MTTWKQQWLHGFLDMCLLCLLTDRPDYGLGMSERLAQAGVGEVPGGTLYPSLLRLEKQGLVSTEWRPSSSGPRRKYYRLTTEGEAAARDRADEWAQFRTAIDAVTATARTAEDAR